MAVKKGSPDSTLMTLLMDKKKCHFQWDSSNSSASCRVETVTFAKKEIIFHLQPDASYTEVSSLLPSGRSEHISY